jgi:molybdopterin biosynthesis enzyme MoaB
MHELPIIKVAILTLSDKGAEGRRKDKSGPLINRTMKKINAQVVSYEILPDDRKLIKKKLLSLCNKVRGHRSLSKGCDT